MSDPQQSQPPRVDPATGRAPGVGRWHGLIWLVIAVLAPAVWIWPRTAGGDLEPLQQFWYALGLLALGVAATVIQEFRGLQRGDNPVTSGLPLIAFVALVLVVTMVALIWDPPLTLWFVALALLPAMPCAIAGLRILTRSATDQPGPKQPGSA